MKRDDFENRFKTAFDMVQTDAADFAPKTLAPRRTRFKTKLAATFAACFLLMVTAAAAYAYQRRGGMDWLAETLGEDEIQLLQPIGFANFEFDERYRVGSTVTEDEIYIELIAVGVDGDYMDVYLMMQDLSGTRNWDTATFNERHTIFHLLHFTDPELRVLGIEGDFLLTGWDNRGSSTEFTVIDRDEENYSVLLHSRMFRPSLLEGVDPGDTDVRELTLYFFGMDYDFDEPREYILDADLGALLAQPASVSPGNPDIGRRAQFQLTPHSHSTTLYFGEHYIFLSAIGFVGNELRVQTRVGVHNRRHLSDVFLVNVNGKPAARHPHSVGVIINDQGEICTLPQFDEHGRLLPDATPFKGYRETTFFINPDNIDDYRLHITFAPFRHTAINWEAQFTLQGGTNLPSPRPRRETNFVTISPTGPRIRDIIEDPAVAHYIGEPTTRHCDEDENRIYSTYPFELMFSTGDRESIVFICQHGEIFTYHNLHLLPPLLQEYIMSRFYFSIQLNEYVSGWFR